MVGSDNYDEISNLREELNVELEEIFPFVFNGNIKHYVNDVNIKELASRYNLMSKACKCRDEEIIIMLLLHQMEVTVDDILTFYDIEITSGYYARDNDYSQTLRILEK